MTVARATPYAPGDLVAPKSGGPVMIVAGYAEDGDVDCLFFNDRTGEFERMEFGPLFLTPFGAGDRDFEIAAQAGPATRAALAAANLAAPFRADQGAVRDAKGAHLCDALPDRPEGDAKAAAAARAIAAALNAICGI